MTKSEFVDDVADRARPGQEGRRRRPSTPSSTRSRSTLSAGSDVTFSGFGKFHVAERGAREGVQPAHGRADADRGLQGPALHRRLGPQEGRQGLSARASAGRRERRRPPRRSATGSPRPSPSASRRSSSASIPIPRACGRRAARARRRARRRTAAERGRRGASAAHCALALDRRRRAGVRRRQAPARLLRAPRRRGLGGARAPRRATPATPACSCSPTASAATSP